MWRTVCVWFLLGVVLWPVGARADVASAKYVEEIVSSVRVQSDWSQNDSGALDYIKNKPDVPSPDAVEYVANKTNSVSDASTDAQYPSARAVNTALAQKADVDDVRFDTIPTSQPAGTPPAGQVFIWFN